jgi:hypothetical protein
MGTLLHCVIPTFTKILWNFFVLQWDWVAHLFEVLRYSPEGRGFGPDGVIGIFFIEITLSFALQPGVWLSFYQK